LQNSAGSHLLDHTPHTARLQACLITLTQLTIDMTYRTYRVSFRTGTGQERNLPVMASTAVLARESLLALGYDVQKVVHCFPSV